MNTKNITSLYAVTLVVICLCILCFKYLWSRRYLYYYASQFEGPFAWPLIGSVHLFWEGHKGFHKKMTEIFSSQASIFKFWLGQDLLIVTSKPSDIEILSNSCLEKGKFYNLGKNIVREGLLNEPVSKWKVNRKIINPTFNSAVLNSFVDVFCAHSKELVQTLESNCDGNPFDFLMKIFHCSLNISIETLCDIKPSLIQDKDQFIEKILRMEEIMTIRVFSIWLHPDYIFKYTLLGREFEKLTEETFEFINKITNTKKANFRNQNTIGDLKRKQFLNHLFSVAEKESALTEHVISEETQTILVTASETAAITISMILLVLSLRRDILEKVNDELDSIFDSVERNATLEDMNRMVYLECVINETMRLFPTVPIVLRTVTENVKLDTYVVPKGSFVLIPICNIHLKPDIWKDPMTFNPDRFLYQKEATRHRCAFIPFSYGFRNCIVMSGEQHNL
ncbi:cytochrome P450 4C1-like isoform X2 [Zophobas morio]|uniref:cytochrome P450 4C1-like isoform X2 n=1 Tax=Zophobas morio TaxID=2755281 RepID=UPI003083C2A1